MLSENSKPNTCMIYDGFNGALRYPTAKRCKLTEQLDEGRPPVSGGLFWTHFIDLDLDVDIRDRCTRSAGTNTLTYADGDKVIIPDVNGTVYVVVFVTPMALNTRHEYRRAYLMRHDAQFDGTGWS